MGGRANAVRGEHSLVLAGKTYLLRPSHEAMQAIETQTRPVLALVRLSNAGELSLEQLGIIGAELIRAGAAEDDTMTRAVSAERISELIMEEGISKVVSCFTMVLLDVAIGGRTASGEAKAAPATKARTGAA